MVTKSCDTIHNAGMRGYSVQGYDTYTLVGVTESVMGYCSVRRGVTRFQRGRMPAAVSTNLTSSFNASIPSSNQWQYSTARKRTPLLPFVLPFPLPPLPFGRPLVGIPVPGGAPFGASNVVNWA